MDVLYYVDRNGTLLYLWLMMSKMSIIPQHRHYFIVFLADSQKPSRKIGSVMLQDMEVRDLLLLIA
jgi:uncharacterized protein YbgA (DUF1722 family)